jgi:hypothetical protein
MYLAEFIKYAFVNAGLGAFRLLLMKYCRSSAQQPANAGVE